METKTEKDTWADIKNASIDATVILNVWKTASGEWAHYPVLWRKPFKPTKFLLLPPLPQPEGKADE